MTRVRRRGIATFALGVSAGVLAYGALSAGVLTSGTARLVGAVGDLVRVPAAAADGLPAFADCAELRRWYVRAALPKVGPWGLGASGVYALSDPAVPGSARAEASAGTAAGGTPGGTDGAVGSSGTGTNVQEADVDEPDVAKTDGRLVVSLSGNTLVVTDVSGTRPRTLSTTRLPDTALTRPELLLKGDHALVVGEETPFFGGPIVEGGPLVQGGESGPDTPQSLIPGPAQDARTHLIGIDLTDPSAPRMTGDRSIDGGAISTREYSDGTVRVVVTTGFPPLDFVRPNRDRTPAQATRLNRDVVRSAPLSAWLPGIRSGSGVRQSLLDCSAVRHPLRASGFGTISVLAFPFDDPGAYDATAVTASGSLAYSSTTRLYVATATGGTTQVHAFALEGDRTTYVASGSLRGAVKDRWSFDEHNGHLRVAAEEWPRHARPSDPWRPGDNAVLVFTEHGGRLELTGRVGGLGRGEELRSVRWFGDLAVVVTFRQTDPLYTVDLTDADRPRLVGTLKLPGFSSYLHPVGDHRLVGVGHDATGTGTDLGAQVATFDLRDLADVRRTDRLSLGDRSDVSAGTDPRAFTYLPQQRTLVTPVQNWSTGRSRFLALHVGPGGSLTRVASWSGEASGTDARALPLGGGRVALVGARVRVVDVS